MFATSLCLSTCNCYSTVKRIHGYNNNNNNITHVVSTAWRQNLSSLFGVKLENYDLTKMDAINSVPSSSFHVWLWTNATRQVNEKGCKLKTNQLNFPALGIQFYMLSANA